MILFWCLCFIRMDYRGSRARNRKFPKLPGRKIIEFWGSRARQRRFPQLPGPTFQRSGPRVPGSDQTQKGLVATCFRHPYVCRKCARGAQNVKPRRFAPCQRGAFGASDCRVCREDKKFAKSLNLLRFATKIAPVAPANPTVISVQLGKRGQKREPYWKNRFQDNF